MNAGEQLGVYSKVVAVLMKRNGLAFIWFIGDGCDDRTDGGVMKRDVSGTSAGWAAPCTIGPFPEEQFYVRLEVAMGWPAD